MKTQVKSEKSKAMVINDQIKSLPESIHISNRERKGLQTIYRHAGKRKVFELYLKLNPEIARKYLNFVSRNRWVRYIIWDKRRQAFVIA